MTMVGSRDGVWPVASSVDELIAGATEREPLAHTDGKSGVLIERVVIGGERFVLKHVHPSDDWIMRATGDLGCRPVWIWRSGVLADVPAVIDHTMVGAAWDDRPDGSRGGAVLMRDVADQLVPEGDHPLPLDQHRRFLSHMAELHASFWGWTDRVGLTPLGTRVVWFGPRLADTESRLGGTHPVPTELVPEGWRRFASLGLRSAPGVLALLDDPDPLVAVLTSVPHTFIHGDWKAGNLGSHPDGRTVLIDWAYGGASPPGIDLAHYLALNRARLPESKDAAIAAYREALERCGIDTEPWWDRQLSACLLVMMCNFGWEKALGDSDDARDELAWWDGAAAAGLELLDA